MEDKIFGKDKVNELKDLKVERISYVLHIFESLRPKNHITEGVVDQNLKSIWRITP